VLKRARSNKGTEGSSCFICTCQLMFGQSNEGEWDGWGMWHVLEGMHTVFW